MTINLIRKTALVAATMAAATAMASPVQTGNLVKNGDFETNSRVGILNTVGATANWTSDWSTRDNTQAFNFIVDAAADSTGFNSNVGPIYLWGPGTGSFNGFRFNSSNHKYVLGSDGAYASSNIWQNVDNLVIGQKYVLSFEWAGAQFTDSQLNYSIQWKGAFGNKAFATDVAYVNHKGFKDWETVSFTFIADAVSQKLSFLADGGPVGLGSAGGPPFALLDNVTVQAVPEPSTVALMLGGFAVVGAVARRRKSVK